LAVATAAGLPLADGAIAAPASSAPLAAQLGATLVMQCAARAFRARHRVATRRYVRGKKLDEQVEDQVKTCQTVVRGRLARTRVNALLLQQASAPAVGVVAAVAAVPVHVGPILDSRLRSPDAPAVVVQRSTEVDCEEDEVQLADDTHQCNQCGRECEVHLLVEYTHPSLEIIFWCGAQSVFLL
jgi:hypothetical protein